MPKLHFEAQQKENHSAYHAYMSLFSYNRCVCVGGGGGGEGAALLMGAYSSGYSKTDDGVGSLRISSCL